MPAVKSDRLRRFLFDDTRIRGELVSLDETFRAAVLRHDYPAPVKTLVGEVMAAAALLGATIKFEGSLILQIQSDGPVHLMVAQVNCDRSLRGLARWKGEVTTGPLAAMTGAGKLAITIDPGPGKERYQGIVELEGETLAASIEEYFTRSEQLSTRLWLATGEGRSAGLLLQQLPGAEDEDAETWERIVVLAETLTSDELASLDGDEILRRLFHQEEIRLFDGEPLEFRCTCSHETIVSLVRAFGREEAESIVREEGGVHVDCEFCNQRFELDAIDVTALFDATNEAPTTSQ